MRANKYLRELRSRLDQLVWVRIVIAILMGAALPAAIGYLINLATGRPDNGAFIAGILILAVLQGLLLLVTIIEESRGPLNLLASAAEIDDELEDRKQELERRDAALAVIRDSLVEMNAHVCRMDLQYTDCKQGFSQGLRSILQSVLDQSQLVLGVSHHQHGIQVYFKKGVVTAGTDDDFRDVADDLEVVLTLSHHTTSNDIAAMGDLDAGVYAMKYSPRSRLVSELPEVFGENTDDFYFRRFAWQWISEICADPEEPPVPIGVLVLTSKQTAEFAEDVLETLGLLTVAISKYLWSYNKCLEEGQAPNSGP